MGFGFRVWGWSVFVGPARLYFLGVGRLEYAFHDLGMYASGLCASDLGASSRVLDSGASCSSRPLTCMCFSSLKVVQHLTYLRIRKHRFEGTL